MYQIDINVFNKIFETYNRPLLYFANSIISNESIAEEIVSDCFIKVWERQDSFESQQKVKAFLYISTRNACVNQLTLDKRYERVDIDTIEELYEEDPESYIHYIKVELLELITNQVAKLPKQQRRVFELTYFEDSSTEEICQLLNMDKSAVFTNRSRAIDKLKKALKAENLILALLLLEEILKKSNL